MIVIWDNGGCYSDHIIRFVEIGDVAVEHAIALLQGDERDGYAIGTAEQIEWRSTGETCQLFDQVSSSLKESVLKKVPVDLAMALLKHERDRVRGFLDKAEVARDPGWKRNLEAMLSNLQNLQKAIETPGTGGDR